MGHHARGEVWIPLEDWYEFVSNFTPRTSGEVSYGPPRQEASEIVVPFALNTECHPHAEAEPPEWAKK